MGGTSSSGLSTMFYDRLLAFRAFIYQYDRLKSSLAGFGCVLVCATSPCA